MRYRRFLLVWILAIGTACAARKPGETPKPGFNVFSQDDEVKLGREAAAQIRQQVQIVQDRELQDYVRSIGRRLASQRDAGGYPYEFTVINDRDINAFALPGGPIFIHTGTIANADNEAQLAGVMAHEISHVALRHATNQASKANILQLPAAIASAVLGQGSVLAQLGQLGLGLGLNSVLLKYSRDAERQADVLGAHLMAGAGYNPVEMAHFFEKLEAQGSRRAPEFLSSHPDPGNRVQLVQQEIQAMPRRSYASDSGRFSGAKSLVAQLPEPRQRTQVAQARSAPPSDFRRLSNARFDMAYPSGWQVYNDRSGGVTIAPREGLVQTRSGSVAIGYGAVVNYYRPQSRSLQSATQELLQQLQANNGTFRIAAQPRRGSIDGNPAMITSLVSQSPYGGVERDILVTISRPEGLFYMVFAAPEEGYDRLDDAFNRMLNSLRFRSA